MNDVPLRHLTALSLVEGLLEVDQQIPTSARSELPKSVISADTVAELCVIFSIFVIVTDGTELLPKVTNCLISP